MSENVILYQEYITLGQMLKEVGVIDSGGQAKPYLAENVLIVDGEDEQRRGRKLYTGMTIEIPTGEVYVMTKPTPEQQAEHEEEIAEKERVSEMVKKMNAENKAAKEKQQAKKRARRDKFSKKGMGNDGLGQSRTKSRGKGRGKPVSPVPKKKDNSRAQGGPPRVPGA
jgi:S4 domain protein YaaA